MTQIPDKIFAKYGLSSVVAILAAALLIWVAAHLTAAPGTNVSVLWGLVEYQKRAVGSAGVNRNRPTHSAPDSSSVGETIATPLVAIDLQLIAGLTAANSAEAVSGLREVRGLRQLTAFESGRPVAEVPPNTFFFLLGGWFRTYDESATERVANLHAYRFKRSEHAHYELHNTADGLYLLAYITEPDVSRVSRLNGMDSVKIVAAPIVDQGFSALVSFPVTRIESMRSRDLETEPGQTSVTILDLVLR